MITSLKHIYSVFNLVLTDPSNQNERIKRLFMAFTWQLWKRLRLPPLIATLDNGARFILDPISQNSTGAIYTKVYAANYVNFARKHVSPGGTMVDVGAHTGLYTLLLAHIINDAVLIEPSPDTFELLRRNVSLNALPARLIRAAASARSGTGKLAIVGSNSAENFLANQGIDVDLVTLDEALNGSNLVTFLKIDVEGAELAVLEGAKGILAHHAGMLVQIECVKDPDAAVALLANLGFSTFLLDRNGDPVPYGTREVEGDLFAFGSKHPYLQGPRTS